MRRIVLPVLALTLVLASAAAARAQAASGDAWQVTIAPYFMGASLNGATTVKGYEVTVDVSMSDIFDHLQFGAMGLVVARKGSWGVGGDAIWMSLGADGTGPGPIGVSPSVDFNQGAFAFYGLRPPGCRRRSHLWRPGEHAAGQRARHRAARRARRRPDGHLVRPAGGGDPAHARSRAVKRAHFAMAIQVRATVYDLEEAEPCYAPPFGSAKDAVNFAGTVAGNLPRGDMPIVHWDGVGTSSTCAILRSSRSSPCRAPSASRCRSCERDWASCPGIARVSSSRSAVRAYDATRILMQNGFKARNISGGMLARSHRAEA